MNKGRKPSDLRKTLDGIWWILLRGSVWNQLPERFGKWNSAYRFHLRWAKRGIFIGLLDKTAAEAQEDEPDEFKSLDATHLKAHQDAYRRTRRGSHDPAEGQPDKLGFIYPGDRPPPQGC